MVGKRTLVDFLLSRPYLPHIMKCGIKKNEAGYCRSFLRRHLGGQSFGGGLAVKVNSGATLALHNKNLNSWRPLGNLDVALQQLGDHLKSLSFLSSS